MFPDRVVSITKAEDSQAAGAPVSEAPVEQDSLDEELADISANVSKSAFDDIDDANVSAFSFTNLDPVKISPLNPGPESYQGEPITEPVSEPSSRK